MFEIIDDEVSIPEKIQNINEKGIACLKIKTKDFLSVYSYSLFRQ